MELIMAKNKKRKGPARTLPFAERLKEEFNFGVTTTYETVKMLSVTVIRNMNINNEYFDDETLKKFLCEFLDGIDSGIKDLGDDNTAYDTLAGSCERVLDAHDIPHDNFWVDDENDK